MATLSRIAMTGMMTIAEPSWEIIPENEVAVEETRGGAVSLLALSKWRPVLLVACMLRAGAGMEKGGGWGAGSPASISPVRVKAQG